jgi:hypothetical protein
MRNRLLHLLLLVVPTLFALTPIAAQERIVCEPGFHLFTHELLWTGTPDGVCIPEQPQRIAFAWIFHVPALLRSDFPFAGIGSQEYVINEFPEWRPIIETIADIGLPPNLEAILELEHWPKCISRLRVCPMLTTYSWTNTRHALTS